MKDYTVYFIIKKDAHGYLNQETVTAQTQKEAIRQVKEKVKRNTGRTAFTCTCKPPKRVQAGMIYNNSLYTRYNETWNLLW